MARRKQRKERSWICLFPFEERKIEDFFIDPFHGSIKKSSIFLSSNQRFRGPLRFQRNLRERPFLRFRRNRKEGQKILPIHGSGKTALGIRENGSPPIPGPLRFPWNLRGRPFLRFRRNRKERQDVFFLCPCGAEGIKSFGIGGDAPLPSKIACDFRRQRSGPPKIHRIFGGQRKKRSKIFFPRKEKSSMKLIILGFV